MMFNINEEMKCHFLKRTNKHVAKVRFFLNKAMEIYPKYTDELIICKMRHDESKFQVPDIIPYVYITWQYHCEKTGKDFVIDDKERELMNNATFHHVISEPHHPEFWDETLVDNPINIQNRHKKSKIITNATKMTNEYIVEMCCDWSAVGIERESNPVDWADENVNKRWMFKDKQVSLIYDTLQKLNK